MVLTARPLPRTSASLSSWLTTPYRRVANVMMTNWDRGRAADYEERAIVAEHHEALEQETPVTAT
jgi:hypothetical protein